MGVEYKRYLLPRDNSYRPSAEQLAQLVGAWIDNKYVPKPDGNALPNGAIISAAQPGGKTLTIRDTRADHAKKSGAYFMTRACEPQPLPLGQLYETFAAKLALPELLCAWPIPNTKALSVQYPLRLVPDMGDPDVGPYLDLMIEIADDYVYRVSECIDLLASSKCSCGVELSYQPGEDDVFYSARIHRLCPSCGATFRPQDHMATLRDGVSGTVTKEMGGAVSRFAIVIDCGKAFEIEMDGVTGERMAVRALPQFVRLCEGALGMKLYEVGDFY